MRLFIVAAFVFSSHPSIFVLVSFFIVMDVDVLICCVSLLGSSCCHLVWSRVGCAHVFEVTLVLAVVS